MESYDEFWKNLKNLNDDDIGNYEVFLSNQNRSSTIFPVFKKKETKVSLEFLTYWVRKHNTNVIIRFVARDIKGNILAKNYRVILKFCAVTYNVYNLFNTDGNGFCGSIEVEVFSKLKPLYTFPAISLSFHSNDSSSIVHSCIRTYNKFEQIKDYAINFPQTGFDIIFSSSKKNYICFIGGNQKQYELTILLEERNFTEKRCIRLANHQYGQMHTIFIEDLFFKKDILKFKNPKAIIYHNLDDVFPRFYVGIINKLNVPTLTHTFFDTSEKRFNSLDANKFNFRSKNTSSSVFDSAFMVPIFPTNKFETSLISYGQNLKFEGHVELRIYSKNGKLVFKRALENREVKLLCQMSSFDMSSEATTASLPSDSDKYSLFLGFVGNQKPFPKRFKLGFNVKRKEAELGTNICFSPLVINENSLNKPFTRRWFPLGGSQNFVASIHNTELLINNFSGETNFLFEFVNYEGIILKRKIVLKSNSSFFLDKDHDDELISLFEDKVGWCIVTAETYHMDAYFFSIAKNQIGGDHAF